MSKAENSNKSKKRLPMLKTKVWMVREKRELSRGPKMGLRETDIV